MRALVGLLLAADEPTARLTVQRSGNTTNESAILSNTDTVVQVSASECSESLYKRTARGTGVCVCARGALGRALRCLLMATRRRARRIYGSLHGRWLPAQPPTRDSHLFSPGEAATPRAPANVTPNKQKGDSIRVGGATMYGREIHASARQRAARTSQKHERSIRPPFLLIGRAPGERRRPLRDASDRCDVTNENPDGFRVNYFNRVAP